MESSYFAGNTLSLSALYSRLVLIADRPKVAEIALARFEELLNYPHVTEKDFQLFFQLHPEFLLRDEYDSFWAEPILRSPTTGNMIRPDFILQPHGKHDTPWNWAVLDLKRPDVPLIANNRFHADFSKHVYRVLTQLKDYGDFFSDPRNHEMLCQRFGGIIPQPKLTAVIGRLPARDRDRYAILQGRLQGVSITKYDEIIEFRKSKVAWIRALGL
jgi:hypothetical protein